jgi:hypothetical protein
MPLGEIFTGAFQRIWRNKKLWLLAMLGLALGVVGTLIYGLFGARWMSDYFNWINLLMRSGEVMPQRIMGNLMSSMTWIWAGAAFAGLFGLLGYVVNLVARGAIINEAAYAWRNETTIAGRGLRKGLSRGAYVFLIDLIWWLPAFLLVLGGTIAFFVLVVGSAAASNAERAGGLIATSWLAFLCGGCCIGVLYYLVYVVFAPLMYQSAVAGGRDLGAALSEGWTMARNNLGSMIIFWLLLLIVGVVLGLIVQAISSLFQLPLWTGWFRAFSESMPGLGDGAMPIIPRISGPLLVFATLVSAGLSFLVRTFTETLNLTVYAGVYQHLAGPGQAEPVSVSSETAGLATGEQVTTVTPIAPDAPIVEPPEPTEPEVPPTL